MARENSSERSLLIATIGDLHLRDTQYATTRRGYDFFAAAKRAVIAACQSDADVIVCTGDIFDVARPSAKVIGQLVQLDREVAMRGKRMLCITGNHDYSNPTWLDTLFPVWQQEKGPYEDMVGIIPVDGRSVVEKGFTITGLPPYTYAAFREKLAEIEAVVRDSDVILYHGFVTGITPVFAGHKNVLDVSELPTGSHTKAILLGDIHVQEYVTVKGAAGQDVLVGYQGSLEMCSASEPTEKSIPLIRVTESGAVVESTIPTTIRPFIHRKVRTEEELDELVEIVTKVAAEHPVVAIEFDRNLTQTLPRLHAILDAQRAVIRCSPLPSSAEFVPRTVTKSEEADLGMEHFIQRKFSDDPELADVALQLFFRGESDWSSIITGMVDSRLTATKVRE